MDSNHTINSAPSAPVMPDEAVKAVGEFFRDYLRRRHGHDFVISREEAAPAKATTRSITKAEA